MNAPVQTTLVARDVEAPDIFQATGLALWDGRPSLGGVWVASPDTRDPKRVIMRNPANGKFVIGALFHREPDNPGPALQISSDAAAALGILAGEPVKISVTALKREQGPVTQPEAKTPLLNTAETASPASAAEGGPTSAAAQKMPPARPPATSAVTPTVTLSPVTTSPVTVSPMAPLPTSTVTAGAASAIDSAAASQAPTTTAQKLPAARPAAATPTPPPSRPAAPPAATGPEVQVGIFSAEANAQRAVDMLAKAGVIARICIEQSHGKTYWRVTARGDQATLARVKAAGFTDAYILK